VPQPRAGTTKQALARIQRLCCLGVGGEMLMPDLMREVMGLVRSRHGVFCWAGQNAEMANFYGTIPPSAAELFFKEFHRTRRETDFISTFSEHRVWPIPTPVLQHRQTLRTDHRTFLRSDFYNVLWRRQADIDEPLIMIVREAGRTHGTLTVYRAPGEPPYEAGAVRTLASIAGFVAHAMNRAELGEEAFVESEDNGLFVADIGGAVRHADVQTQHLLVMALTPLRSPATGWRRPREPAPELARLCHTLVATANGRIGQPPPVLRLRNPWGEFVLRAYWLEPTDGAEQTRNIGITIARRVPRALAMHRRLEDLPLTGREKQLCLLLGHGRSRQVLADAMGVSTGTIITHQRSIHAKLGVHSRAGLLAALLPG
jgi:DNA-binding CsgD family transcriptional regulator